MSRLEKVQFIDMDLPDLSKAEKQVAAAIIKTVQMKKILECLGEDIKNNNPAMTESLDLAIEMNTLMLSELRVGASQNIKESVDRTLKQIIEYQDQRKGEF